MSATAELLDGFVADPCSSEKFIERICIELRAMARFGYRPDVHDLLDPVILQYLYEFINGMS